MDPTILFYVKNCSNGRRLTSGAGLRSNIALKQAVQNKQSCILSDPKKNSLGFKKLAFLFLLLVSGIFISIFAVLFEFIAKIHSEKQKLTTMSESCEINSENDEINEFFEALSFEETEKVFQRIVKRKMNTSNSQDLI